MLHKILEDKRYERNEGENYMRSFVIYTHLTEILMQLNKG